jgi:hypothetical protein
MLFLETDSRYSQYPQLPKRSTRLLSNVKSPTLCCKYLPYVQYSAVPSRAQAQHSLAL